MSALMSERCEECGEMYVHEKDDDGLEAVEMGNGQIVNMCPDCAEKQRAEDAATRAEE